MQKNGDYLDDSVVEVYDDTENGVGDLSKLEPTLLTQCEHVNVRNINNNNYPQNYKKSR